jgi:membrane-associated protease RseP (regulator of RpoE activity)
MAVFFFNLLPVPPLDGFHIACSVIEIVIRRELPARAISMLMYLGWLLLAAWLLLNAFVIVKDLVGTIL